MYKIAESLYCTPETIKHSTLLILEFFLKEVVPVAVIDKIQGYPHLTTP